MGEGHQNGQFLHDNRRREEALRAFFTTAAGTLCKDTKGAFHQLFIAGTHINHKILIDLSQLDHGAGGEHMRISFWAVPAFMRVEPVITSGPVTVSMGISAWEETAAWETQAMEPVSAPMERA